MYSWEKLFDSVALARARAIDSSRVTIEKRDDTHIDAAVMSMGRTEVSITLRDGVPYIMKCKCPKARSGRKCEHMAAALYKIEETGRAGAKENTAPEQETVAPRKNTVAKASGGTKKAQAGIDDLQKLWDTAIGQDPEEAPAPKKRGGKSKAQLEAERIAAEEAARQRKRRQSGGSRSGKPRRRQRRQTAGAGVRRQRKRSKERARRRLRGGRKRKRGSRRKRHASDRRSRRSAKKPKKEKGSRKRKQ